MFSIREVSGPSRATVVWDTKGEEVLATMATGFSTVLTIPGPKLQYRIDGERTARKHLV